MTDTVAAEPLDTLVVYVPREATSDVLEAVFAAGAGAGHCFAMTTKGARLIGEFRFVPGDVFVFGRETAGLSAEQMAMFEPGQRVRLPMMPRQRSLNLSNSVAVTVFEAWRQAGYEGGV